MNDELDDLDFDVTNVNTPPTEAPKTSVEDNLEEEVIDNNNSTEDDTNLSLEETDLITDLLRARGITDPKAIKFTDDKGNITEHDFNSLSKEEQLEILNSSDDEDDDELTQDELNIIKFIRDNNLTVDQYNKYIGKQAVDGYVESNSQVQYAIDSLSDEELYLLDLKQTIKNISDDDAQAYLSHEKENEQLWSKKIAGLRDSYKEKEVEQTKEQNKLAEAEQEQQWKEYNQTMSDAINNVKIPNYFTLGDEDKQEMASLILGQDATGTNNLYKALSDPQTLAKVAWYITQGDKAFDMLTDYWRNAIKSRTPKPSETSTVHKSQQSSTTKSGARSFISLNEVKDVLDLD